MCVFDGEVTVANTRIAVCQCANDGRQFTMYENAISHSVDANAMILAVPGDAAKLELIDVSATEDPWDKLEEPVYTGGGSGRDEYDLASFCAVDDDPPLEVVQVGGYRCSIAPGLADLKRSKAIQLPPNIESILGEHYPAGYCFLICQFDAITGDDKRKMHPIAYKHEMHVSGCLFIPTLHAHGKATGDETESKRAKTHDDAVRIDWDHVLYLINAHLYLRSRDNSIDEYSWPKCRNIGELATGVECPVKSVQRVRIFRYTTTPNGDHWAK